MFNIYFWIIVGILFVSHFSGLYLDRLNALMWSDIVPDKLKGIIDQDRYKKSQNYYRDNKGLSMSNQRILIFLQEM